MNDKAKSDGKSAPIPKWIREMGIRAAKVLIFPILGVFVIAWVIREDPLPLVFAVSAAAPLVIALQVVWLEKYKGRTILRPIGSAVVAVGAAVFATSFAFVLKPSASADVFLTFYLMLGSFWMAIHVQAVGPRLSWFTTPNVEVLNPLEVRARTPLQLERATTLKEAHPEISLPRAMVIHELLSRAGRLRITNGLLLVLMIAVLSGSVFFVIYAGKLAGQDSQSFTLLRQLQQSAESAEETLRRLEGNFEEEKKTEARVARLQRARSEYERLAGLRNEFERSAYQNSVATKSGEADPNLLVAAGLARFGVLALSIYLVQILIGLYRYNAQAEALYSSQADALLLAGPEANDKVHLSDLMIRLRPNFSFGKPEASLPEKVLDKISETVKSTIEKANGAGRTDKT